jgi:hypothetical protein
MSFIFESRFPVGSDGQRWKIKLETPPIKDDILSLSEQIDGAILDKDDAIKWFAHHLNLANKRNRELRKQILKLKAIIGI